MKKHLLSAISRLLSVLVFLSCYVLIPETPVSAQQAFPKSYSDQFQQILNNGYVTEGAKGATMGVYSYKCNLIWSGAAGYALEMDSLAKPDAKFRLASVSKTFCATIILQLVDSGKLVLDDKINKYLRQSLVDTIPNGNNITIRQLLQHTSGIKTHTSSQSWINQFNSDPTGSISAEKCIKYAADMGSAGAPGTTYSYSNTNYLIASLIAENVSGIKYKDLVQQYIINKLGLKNTFYPADVPNDWRIPGHYLREYYNGSLFVNYSATYSLQGSGEMISSAEDLLRYYEAVYHAKLFSQAMVNEMYKTTSVSPSYGLGANIYNSSCSGNPRVGHGGNLYGISTGVYYIKSLDAVISFGENVYGKSGSAYICNVVNVLKGMTTCPTTTGNDDEKEPLSLKVYPNPSDGNFTVDISGSREEVLNVSVVNITGQVLFEEKLSVTSGYLLKSYNLFGLPGGVYCVKAEAGGVAHHTKIIIQ